MHILLLTAYFPPDTGSAAHLFFELGRAFVGRGQQVSVLTGFPSYYAQGDLARYRGRLWVCEQMEGMEVMRVALPQVARDTPVGRGLWQFSCAAGLGLAGLTGARADVCLVYSPPLPLALAALGWRVFRGVPFVLNVQDLFPQSAVDLGLLRDGPMLRFFEALERFVYRQADALTVHSWGNRAHLLAKGGRAERTVVVQNSVDTEEIRPGPKDNGLRHELGLDGRFVVSFAGVIGRSQDLDVVLEAAGLLHEHTQIHFLLVGDGVERDRLLSKARDMGLANVTWLPMQPRERYPSVLQASDVGLATLRADVKTPVVPSKILNIMAAGRPVVATADLRGDAPRLIAEAGAGFCLEPQRPQALADTILRLFQDPALCQRLGENGRRYAEAHLSPAAVAAGYEQLIRQVAAGRTARPRRQEP